MINYKELEKALLSMPNLVDKRGALPTWNSLKQKEIAAGEADFREYRKRPLEAIKFEAIHHSATFQGSPEAFARYHVMHNGWPGIGYHFVIEDNEDQIAWCYDLDVRTAHVGNSNGIAIGTCIIGDFTKQEPQEHQLNNAAKLSHILIDYLPNIEAIKSHSDFPGYEWKKCCAFDVMRITNRM